MRHPVSTITNLAYVAVGIGLMNAPPVGIALIALGLASFMYHATNLGWAQKADVACIYLSLWALIGWQLSGDAVFTAIFAATLGGYMAFTHKSWDSFKAAPLLFGLLVLIRIWQMESLMFVGPFAIGALFSALGRLPEVDEDVPHALWHCLTAYGFWLAI